MLQRGVLTVGIQAYLTGAKSVKGLKASDTEFGKFNRYDAASAVDATLLSKEEKVYALSALLIVTEKVKANGEYDKTAARLAVRGDLQNAEDIGTSSVARWIRSQSLSSSRSCACSIWSQLLLI